jgi:hypothetical protein
MGAAQSRVLGAVVQLVAFLEVMRVIKVIKE